MRLELCKLLLTSPGRLRRCAARSQRRELHAAGHLECAHVLVAERGSGCRCAGYDQRCLGRSGAKKACSACFAVAFGILSQHGPAHLQTELTVPGFAVHRQGSEGSLQAAHCRAGGGPRCSAGRWVKLQLLAVSHVRGTVPGTSWGGEPAGGVLSLPSHRVESCRSQRCPAPAG